MKKKIFLICIAFFCYGTALADIKKASVPNVDIPVSLGTVMSKKDSMLMKKEKALADETNGVPETNGYVANQGNIAVDNLTEPKCVFYGNYNSGADGSFQHFNIDTIVFECQ